MYGMYGLSLPYEGMVLYDWLGLCMGSAWAHATWVVDLCVWRRQAYQTVGNPQTKTVGEDPVTNRAIYDYKSQWEDSCQKGAWVSVLTLVPAPPWAGHDFKVGCYTAVPPYGSGHR